MPMFPITFTTIPVHADLSVDSKRRQGEQVAYAQGADQQEAEDVARVWLQDLSQAGRVYTPAGKPRRVLGPVRSNPNPTAPVSKDALHAGRFIIFRELAPLTEIPADA